MNSNSKALFMGQHKAISSFSGFSCYTVNLQYLPQGLAKGMSMPCACISVYIFLCYTFFKDAMLLPSAASGVAWPFLRLIDDNEIVLEGFHIYDVVAYPIL